MSSAQDEFDALYNNNRKEPTHSHPEDAASSTASDDSLTLNDDDQINSPSNHHYSPSMPSATYTLPAHTFDANTGPKGVIADARSFETAKKRSFRQTLHAFSNGQSTLLLGGSKQKKQYEREKSASPDISADDDEDDFMRSWRAKRLDELANMNQDLRTRRQSPSQRKYGTLLAVDPSGYLDAVEKVPSDTTVVVLIYDDESILSVVVEDALQILARKHATIRFVKLHQLDAEMDEIAVPGILAYKGGDCFANLVSIMSELPAGREMNSSALEIILQR
ncbi:hypothetical protein MMC31_006512, partial [Peltigera leucophlebia]|nr:hypothetical protein [Peltigera leucophlebia]